LNERCSLTARDEAAMKRDMTAILKKRVAALEAENRAIIAAIIQTVGGAVEGAPLKKTNPEFTE
jgi:hypothetical protein